MSNATAIARVGRASLAAVALLVLPASLAEATYGPRTTIGANYQQTSTTRSPDGINEGACSAVTCYLLFQLPPQQKPLVVQHVSCVVNPTAGELRYVNLGSRTGSTFHNRASYLLPGSTGGITYVASGPVMHLIKAGERPYILLVNSASTTWGAACTISGQLKQP